MVNVEIEKQTALRREGIAVGLQGYMGDLPFSIREDQVLIGKMTTAIDEVTTTASIGLLGDQAGKVNPEYKASIVAKYNDLFKARMDRPESQVIRLDPYATEKAIIQDLQPEVAAELVRARIGDQEHAEELVKCCQTYVADRNKEKQSFGDRPIATISSL